MKDRITVIFCSKKKSEDNMDFINHIKDTCGCNLNSICIYNPDGISLSKIYADIIVSDTVEDDIVVLIHDDIEFLKKDWGKEVIRLFKENKKYGIIGVAGSAQFDEGGAWWNYEKKYGQVLHRWEGKSWLTAFSPLIEKDLQEVVVIDGLFIALHRKRISENFSRSLSGFDFYDIYFCLANYLNKKCKIGVTTNIRVAHNSIGKLKESWYENREIINKEFGEYFPLDIEKKKR